MLRANVCNNFSVVNTQIIVATIDGTIEKKELGDRETENARGASSNMRMLQEKEEGPWDHAWRHSSSLKLGGMKKIGRRGGMAQKVYERLGVGEKNRM